MTAISNRTPAVAVEYDGAKGRRTKTFPPNEAHRARSFYVRKHKEGKNPAMKKVE